MFVLLREISVLISYGIININVIGIVYIFVYVLMNDIWRCSVYKKCNLSDVSINVEVLKSIENRGCFFVNFERS